MVGGRSELGGSAADIGRAFWFVPQSSRWVEEIVAGTRSPVDWVGDVCAALPMAYTEQLVDEALVHTTLYEKVAGWIAAFDDVGRPLSETDQLELLEAALVDVGDHFCAETEGLAEDVGAILASWTSRSDPRGDLRAVLAMVSGNPRVLLATLVRTPRRDRVLSRFMSRIEGTRAAPPELLEELDALRPSYDDE